MSAARDRLWLRLAAVSGVIAPILFTILVLVTGLLTPGYSQFSQTISELGQVGQPYAVLQDANFVVTGILTFVFVVGLYSRIARSRGSRIGSVLLLAYPVAFVLVGTVFPLPSPVHVPLGSIGFFVTLLGVITVSWPMRRDGSWKRFASFTLVAGIVSVGGFFIYGLLQSQTVLMNWLGLAQRLELAPYFVWIEIAAIAMRYFVNKK